MSIKTSQRLLFKQMSCRLDMELEHHDLAIARQIYRRRREEMPIRPRRRFWVRHWYLQRPRMGQYQLLMDQLMLQDESSFKNFTRMDPETFFYILGRIQEAIRKQDTFWREAISPGHKLALTLRYYACGDCYQSMQ